MPQFLHVGCGMRQQSGTTPVLAGPEWREVRLDIDPAIKPDIVADMTDMSAVASGSMDAVYASHTLEHLYPHEVEVALAEFARVLAPDGFAIISCPDLAEVAKLIVAGRITEPAYESSIGPITPLDMLYGHGASLRSGRHFMAHRGGFTGPSLMAALFKAGFASVLCRRHGFQLTGYARRQLTGEAEIRDWATTHFT